MQKFCWYVHLWSSCCGRKMMKTWVCLWNHCLKGGHLFACSVCVFNKFVDVSMGHQYITIAWQQCGRGGGGGGGSTSCLALQGPPMHHYSLTAVCVCSSTSCSGLQGPPMHHYSLTAVCVYMCVYAAAQVALVSKDHQCITTAWQQCVYTCVCMQQHKLLWSPRTTNASLQLDSSVCMCVCV